MKKHGETSPWTFAESSVSSGCELNSVGIRVRGITLLVMCKVGCVGIIFAIVIISSLLPS